MTMRDKYAVLIGALKFLFFVPRARHEQRMWEEFENEFGWIPEACIIKGSCSLSAYTNERAGAQCPEFCRTATRGCLPFATRGRC
jgi:hypothetical protein